MTIDKPIGAYKTERGWAAYNASGQWCPVDADTAAELESARRKRNAKAGKRET